jgi:ATP-dependent Clp protease protease subunit
MKDQLNNLLAKHTGKDIKTIEKDTDRDNFMSADDARKYGLIDKVIKK